MVTGKNNILLTFDDGPHPIWTPKILDLLKEYNTKAIFFVLGKRVLSNAHLIRRMIDEGHFIGNHSMNHWLLLFNTNKIFHAEIVSVHKMMLEQFGYTIRYFRPPWGIIHKKLKIRCETELDYEILLWNTDSLDYIWPFGRRLPVKKYNNENIILMHDGHAFSPVANKKHTLLMLENHLKSLHS
ncbi:MAG: polysaccharide deacetylase family protein [Calditrichaceae bacterium]|nr:polysaccharide deacetylase family protein [Calditrichaceae bacterium]MBN2708875.1 polysaccharide deacetylase family protein [Calditrichaceae bacterium]RQV97599.1 MAG: polysaccharide deacetylase family protein [Calditrichota bacterium]